MWERHKVVHQDHPLLWRGNDVCNVEFDFTDFHSEKIKSAQESYDFLMARWNQEAGFAFNLMIQMKDETDRLTHKLKDKQREIARNNAVAIERNVNFWGHMASGAKEIRDASATFLVVGASFMSGGAALGALGAGSTLKGTAKYEDEVKLSGNKRVADAVVTALGTFGIGLIPGGEGAKKYAWMVVGATANGLVTGGTSLIEGDGVRKSLIGAAMSAGISAVPLIPKLKGMAMPVTLKLEMDAAQLAANTAKRDVENVAAKLAKKIATHRNTVSVTRELKRVSGEQKIAEKFVKTVAKRVDQEANNLTTTRLAAIYTGTVASDGSDLAKKWAANKFGTPAAHSTPPQIQVSSHQQHLIGAPTQLDKPGTNAEYILQTALRPASYRGAG